MEMPGDNRDRANVYRDDDTAAGERVRVLAGQVGRREPRLTRQLERFLPPDQQRSLARARRDVERCRRRSAADLVLALERYLELLDRVLPALPELEQRLRRAGDDFPGLDRGGRWTRSMARAARVESSASKELRRTAALVQRVDAGAELSCHVTNSGLAWFASRLDVQARLRHQDAPFSLHYTWRGPPIWTAPPTERDRFGGANTLAQDGSESGHHVVLATRVPPLLLPLQVRPRSALSALNPLRRRGKVFSDEAFDTIFKYSGDQRSLAAALGPAVRQHLLAMANTDVPLLCVDPQTAYLSWSWSLTKSMLVNGLSALLCLRRRYQADYSPEVE